MTRAWPGKTALLLVLAMTLWINGASCLPPAGPIRIGVMLPLSGPEYRDYRLPLEWALDNVNSANVAGRRLELVYVDLAKEDVTEAARRLSEDSTIMAVIGPATSWRTYLAAPIFVKARKVMVTPTATSADIFRAFSKYGYIWRTVESDVAQVRTLLAMAAESGARRVALLAPDDHYGSTFFDWFGFLATELGLEIAGVRRYAPDGVGPLEALQETLADKPEVLIAAPRNPEEAAAIVKTWRQSGSSARLLFSDAAVGPYLVENLGKDAEGIEGTVPAWDSHTGFDQAFHQKYGRDPTPFAANVYDALALLAYGLERSGGAGGESLAKAVAEVVDARGLETEWDRKGIAEALAAIRSGKLPDVSGATGPLEYDRDFRTDLISSEYGHWRVTNGSFKILKHIPTDESRTAAGGISAFRQLASEHRLQSIEAGAYRPPPRKSLWALIVATSRGWDNYRHQADALAFYQLLRKNGLPDSQIVLITADDIARSENNPQPGQVHNQAGGKDLYQNARIDYRLDKVDAGAIMAVLAGRKSPGTPNVIDSEAGDDILVYLAGHGNSDGIVVGLDRALPEIGKEYSVITPDLLGDTLLDMSGSGKYRRMMVVVEACHGGGLGSAVLPPGVMVISGANEFENSLSANYDAGHGVWLADQFSYAFYRGLSQNPGWTVDQLYRNAYLDVSGSHVTIYANDFGDTAEIPVREFVAP